MARFIIYGAGALGGVMGAELFASGQDVTLIARGAHHDAIKSDGLTYVTQERSVTLPIPVVPHPREITFTDADVVVLAMKSQHTSDAVEALADTATPGIAVVCAQNGVSNEPLALRYFANVYGVSTLGWTIHLAPGVVVGNSAPKRGVYQLGRFPGGIDRVSEDVAGALNAANYQVTVHTDVMRYKYAKLMRNVRNAAQAILEPQLVERVATMIRAECAAAYAAAGIESASDDEWNRLTATGDVISRVPVDGYPDGVSSTWQSIARGVGNTESDHLNGEVVLLGRLHGVPTPVNAVIQRMTRAAARANTAPSSVSEVEFSAALEAELAATGAQPQ